EPNCGARRVEGWMSTTVLSVAVTGGGVVNNAGALVGGKSVKITLTFSSGVTVAGGVPTLALNNHGTATYDAAATAALGDPTKLVFDYTVTPGQDVSALAIQQVKLNGAPIGDVTTANAALSGALTTFDNLAVDTTGPAVTSFTTTNPPLYVPNSTAQYTLTFSESVTGVTAADFTLSTTG